MKLILSLTRYSMLSFLLDWEGEPEYLEVQTLTVLRQTAEGWITSIAPVGSYIVTVQSMLIDPFIVRRCKEQ